MKFPYKKYIYFYPPRPKNNIPSEYISEYQSRRYISQPKLNGSNCMIYTNGDEVKVMNRHGSRMTRFEIPLDEIKKLHTGVKGNWIVINGEYMNKSKKNEEGDFFNHKLVIFDILVYQSNHLTGLSYLERINLLDNLYGKVESDDKYLYKVFDNIYRVKTFDHTDNFESLFKDLIKIDMYEGLVIKQKRSKLEYGRSVSNNSLSQLKVRKPTKNYSF